jgi:hypothetical protein
MAACEASMDELRRERLGSALQGLARQLVLERQRAALLERENKRLRAELEGLRSRLSLVRDAPGGGPGEQDSAMGAEGT